MIKESSSFQEEEECTQDRGLEGRGGALCGVSDLDGTRPGAGCGAGGGRKVGE